MQEIRFIHCADLHIDSPFKRLSEIHPELNEHAKQKDATTTLWGQAMKKTLLEASANLHSELYENDREIKELTESAIYGWTGE